jgi:hypothetical protein
MGKKLIGPANVRQKNSSLPIGSTVSDVNIYISVKKDHIPSPPPVVLVLLLL